ncbi:MAG: stage III sporulation protein AF [Alicyclobacillus sp.]|nr:stage III sporulation protein AF [Alicyclobacillus sp.]
MTAVGEWLKQIILIVLLAVFTEWLLPTQAMQKYVRTVLGLAVIAAILQPLIPFFHGNWAEELAQVAVQQVTGGDGAASQPAGTAPDVRRLQQTLHEQLADRADELAGAAVADAIRSRLGLRPDRVSVTGSASPGELSAEVWLRPTDSARSAEVQYLVAESLGIPLQRVVVRTGPGGTHG